MQILTVLSVAGVHMEQSRNSTEIDYRYQYKVCIEKE